MAVGEVSPPAASRPGTAVTKSDDIRPRALTSRSHPNVTNLGDTRSHDVRIDELLRLPSGKIPRRELRDRERAASLTETGVEAA